MEVYWEMDISGGTQWSHDGHLQYISMMTWKNYEMDHLYCQFFFLAFSCLVTKIQKGDSDVYHHSKNKKRDIYCTETHSQYTKISQLCFLLLTIIHEKYAVDMTASTHYLEFQCSIMLWWRNKIDLLSFECVGVDTWLNSASRLCNGCCTNMQ